MSGPIGVKPTRSDADIRADLAELARWVNARDEDPSLLLFALATDVEPLLFRATMAEDTATELAVEKAQLRHQVAAVRKLLEHARNVSPSRSMTVYVTDLEAALEGRT